MAISHQVLGAPGRDNALYVRIDSGQTIHRLLFDCGEGCASELPVSEIQAIDYLCFSHQHVDHIAGFDAFFRCTFHRDTKPNVIWGPPETAQIMHHRFQGFWWNLLEGQAGHWLVHDVHPDRVETSRFEVGERFTLRHPHAETGPLPFIIDEKDYTVRAIALKHYGVSLGYRVDEKSALNVQTDRLAQMGARPGPWLKDLKSDSEEATIEIEGQTFDREKLRRELLRETPGASIAYLTDFLLDGETFDRLEVELKNCDTVISEAQYRHADLELAERNFHTTTRLVAQLAERAEVGQLILFHLSERYTPEQWREMLEEARSIFPETTFPGHWQ